MNRNDRRSPPWHPTEHDRMARRTWLGLAAWLAFLAPVRAEEKLTLALDAGGHTASVWKVLFSDDGNELFTVSEDKTVRVWDVVTGEPLHTLRPPVGDGDLGALRAAARAGDRLAVGGYTRDDAIYLLSLSGRSLEKVLRGHDNVVFALAFSPDGKRLASGSADNTARIWGVDSGRCLLTLTGHERRVMALAFSPDGRWLATASYDRTARIWDGRTGMFVAELTGHAGELLGIAWSPDGKTLATGGKDESVRLWDAAAGFRPAARIDRLGSAITSLAFSPDGKSLLVTRGPGTSPVSDLIDLSTGKPRVRFDRHNNDVFHGTFSPDGSLVATTGGHDNETYLWRAADGSVAKRLAARSRTPWGVGWSAKGDAVAWGTEPPGRRLDRAFDLSALEMTPVGDLPFRRATTTHEGQPIVVRPTEGGGASVQVGKQAAWTVDLAQNEVPTVFTLLGDGQIALGTTFGLALYDVRSGRRLRAFAGANHAIALAPAPDGRHLLSASNDQVLRVWHPDRTEPLLSLFAAGNDWIAWTPDGYYAASPGGERLMGWHQDRGPERLGTFLPAERFRVSRYRPDAIRGLLAAADDDNVGAPPRTRPKARGAAPLSEVLPPVVVITTPDRSGLELKEPSLEVRFVARPAGPHPIKAVRLLLDGRPYPEAARTFDPPRAGEVREAWTIRVGGGKHAVTAVAETAASKGASEPVEFFFGGRSAVRDDPDGEAHRAAPPALYVLAVGVSEYSDEKLRLRYANKDAAALVQTYQKHSQALYKKVEVKLLTDKEATRKNILGGLTWLRRQMTQNDVAVLFFAGHGEKDADGKLYLLSVDVDRDDLLASGVPGELVKSTLAGFPGRCVLMLDACHAGAVDGAGRRAAGALTDDLARDLVTDDCGVVVMCSAMGREFALESPKVQHGFFTLALVEGLSGKASRAEGGAVYLHHLDAYVTDRVKELSGGRQHPVTVKPGSVRSFPLSRP